MSNRSCPSAMVLWSLLVALGLAAGGAPLRGQSAERVKVLIGFFAPPGPAELAAVRAVGGQVGFSYSLVPAMAASLPPAGVEALRRNPQVRLIEPDVEVRAIAQTTPWGGPHIKADEVQAAGNSGVGIGVCVIDSGIDVLHPDLPPYRHGKDYVRNDEVPDDENGHGTHVAGSVAALNNTQGVLGVAPAADLLVYKILDANGSGHFSSAIAAVEQCLKDGGRITNNSYGSSGDPGTIVRDAFDNAAAAGILHIAAAGNTGSPSGRGNTVNYPARYGSVVAVAAVDSSNARPSWSSYGDQLEISAPGVSILSTYLNQGYASASGTSMASPHVAGVAALVAKGCGLTNPGEIRQRMNSTTDDLGSSGWDRFYGYGLVRADRAVACVPVEDVKDLSVLSVNAPSNVIQGEGAIVSVEVKNTGNNANHITAGDNFEIKLTDSSDSSYSEHVKVGALAVGAATTLNFEVWKALYVGTSTLTATLVDPNKLDAVDSNNSAATSIQVSEPSVSTLTLQATGYKLKGLQAVDLIWSGASSEKVDLYSNGSRIATVANASPYAYTDNINARGGGVYTYQACEAGTNTCSSENTVTF